jgi:hypothetical protein
VIREAYVKHGTSVVEVSEAALPLLGGVRGADVIIDARA